VARFLENLTDVRFYPAARRRQRRPSRLVRRDAAASHRRGPRRPPLPARKLRRVRPLAAGVQPRRGRHPRPDARGPHAPRAGRLVRGFRGLIRRDDRGQLRRRAAGPASASSGRSAAPWTWPSTTTPRPWHCTRRTTRTRCTTTARRLEVDPVEATCGRPVGLAWFSPDCKHFSPGQGRQAGREEDPRPGLGRGPLGRQGPAPRDHAGERPRVRDVGPARGRQQALPPPQGRHVQAVGRLPPQPRATRSNGGRSTRPTTGPRRTASGSSSSPGATASRSLARADPRAGAGEALPDGRRVHRLVAAVPVDLPDARGGPGDRRHPAAGREDDAADRDGPEALRPGQPPAVHRPGATTAGSTSAARTRAGRWRPSPATTATGSSPPT
jgi:hypothetical protein